MPAIIIEGELGDSEWQSNQTHILSCLELGNKNNCSGTDLGSMSETVPFSWVYSGFTKQLHSGLPAHPLQVDTYSLPSKNCVLSLRHPTGGSSLPLTAGMQATTRPMRGRHRHGRRTPHKHWRVAVQGPNPFLIVKTHSYFSSVKITTIIILPCQLKASY